MELGDLTLAFLQVLSLVAFALMFLSFRKAYQLKGFLDGRPGGKVASVTVGVIAGFCIVQGLVVLNTIVISSGSFDVGVFHKCIRVVEQTVFVITTFWAWRRLSEMQ